MLFLGWVMVVCGLSITMLYIMSGLAVGKAAVWALFAMLGYVIVIRNTKDE